MTTGALKSKIDKLWEQFWTGGITNPLTVIEQISFLMFIRLLDISEMRAERKAARGVTRSGGALGKPKHLFRAPGEKRIPPLAKEDRHEFRFGQDQEHLRWQNFKRLGAEEMLSVVRDEVFKHLKSVNDDGSPVFGDFMADAQLMIQKPSLLVSAVNMIDELPLTEGDTKGDLYEYLLSKLTTAGINGQFRTPRHVIRKMVEMLDPKPSEIVGDPACGTAGFLVSVMQYLLEKHTSPDGIIEDKNEDGTFDRHYTGDLLEPYREHIQRRMFHGFDFDVTMLRIAEMNLLLHGVAEPDIHYMDTLSNKFPERFPEQAEGFLDLALANPPFKGSLDDSDVHPSLLRKVKTGKTELLFLALILRMMKIGGRSATIVPAGVLFGSSKAHVAARTLLMDENQLDGVVALPSGVFKPYAGVATAILLFTKGGTTKDVWFYDVAGDGYTLDDNRNPDPKNNDLPEMLAKWHARDPKKDTDRKAKAFVVPADEIRKNDYDLSINKYKEVVHEEVKYDPPKVILERMKKLEAEIGRELRELEGMLR